MLDGKSSEEEELYTDSLGSHTTVSDATTIGNLPSPLGPTSSRVEDPRTVSQTESQFSSNMPYLEEITPAENTSTSNHTSTEDSVFVSQLMIPHQVKLPLLLPDYLEEKENPLKEMARSILFEH